MEEGQGDFEDDGFLEELLGAESNEGGATAEEPEAGAAPTRGVRPPPLAGPGQRNQVRCKDTSSWWDLLTGQHSMKCKVNVPEGVDADEFQDMIDEEIAQEPAPGAKGKRSEDPEERKVWGQSINVSTGHHNTNCETVPKKHLLNGPHATGINISSKQKKDRITVKERSYGSSWPWTRPARHLSGKLMIQPHLGRKIQGAVDKYGGGEEPDKGD